MSRLGLICWPAAGHLNPLIAVGRWLRERGYSVTVFQVADTEAAIRAAGLDFAQIGIQDAPLGSMSKWAEALAELKGVAALKLAREQMCSNARRILSDVPDVMRSLHIEAIVGDWAEAACGSIAEYLRIPFVTLQFSAPVVYDNSLSPVIFGWKHHSGVIARLRNCIGYKAFFAVFAPVLNEVNSQRILWGLRPLNSYDWSSRIAEISQFPPPLEFHGAQRPQRLQYTGPFRDSEGRLQVEFPWWHLNGKPMVYASMGTLFNGVDRVFRIIAEACLPLDIQLVMTLGGSRDPSLMGTLPGSPLVVRYAPQLQVLKHAALTITHAGMNTTLESLAEGVPLVAIPVAADQPAVAARIVASGTGAVVPLRKISVQRLRAAVNEVLGNPKYRESAIRMQSEIQKCDGLRRAGNLIERALGIGNDVRGLAENIPQQEITTS